MKVAHCIPTAVLAALLSACGTSPPLHYYALAAVTPTGTLAPPGGLTLVHVRHISVPPEMDHRGLTHHQGPNQLAISDADQWSAPLTDLVQAAITQDLGARLGFDHVVAAAAQPVADSSPANLDLDFVALSADEGCGITGQVNWTLSVANGPTRRGSAPLAAPGTGCPTGLPAALSTALGALAAQLVQQLTAS